MMFHRTDSFEQRDGGFSAVSFAAVRIASIRTASDAIISIIIRQTAR
jgi:hypothetical protein